MNKEHWTQAIAVLLTAGGMLGLATWTLSTQISSVRADSMAQIAALAARQAADEERMSAMEKVDTRRDVTDATFQSEMRAALSAMITSLADVRVAVGAHHGALK